MPATILNGSTTQSAGLNINLSLLKGGTISQTIVGAIITALVIASTVATIILVSVGVGYSSPRPRADFASTYKRVPVTINVILNDRDTRGGNLTLTQIVNPPKFGTVKILSRSDVIYTSIGAFSGNDTFSYEVSNGFATANATVTVRVLNRAPLAVPIKKKVSKNAKKALINIFTYIGDNDEKISDIDNDILYVTEFYEQKVVSGNPTSLGAIEIDTFNGFLYSPVNGFNGIEQFNYTISDGNDTATSTVTVEVENDAPTAVDDVYRVPKYGSLELSVLLNDFDINGDDFNITNAIGAGYGALRVQDKSIYYFTSSVLTEKYTDSFEYSISDSQLEASAIVSVVVYNTEPTVVSKTVNVGKSSSNNLIAVEYSDPDGKDVVELTQVTPALSSLNPAGSVQYAKSVKRVRLECCDWVSVDYNNYTIVFTPAPGVVYSQVLDLQMYDGESYGYGKITINVVNNPPVAVDDYVDCNKNQQVLINVLANDYDVNPGDTELIQLTNNNWQSNTTNGGSVSIYNSTHVLYVAPKGSLAADVATYRIYDQSKDAQGNPDSTGYSTGKIYINIVNNPPVPVDDVITISKGLISTLNVLDNDYDPNNDVVTTINSVDRSTVKNILADIIKTTGSKDTLKYAATNEEYTDYITYDVVDVDGLVSETKATVTVNVVNDAPVANDDAYSVNWNHNVLCPVKANDADINGDKDNAKIEVSQNPANGIVEVVGDSVRYTPNNGFVGVDTFKYKLNDGSVANYLSNAATVTINVLNTAPIAVDDSVTTHWRNDVGVLVSVLVNDSDNEGDDLSVTNAQVDASAGTASVYDSQTVKFVPTQVSATVGTKQVKYTVSDGNKNTIGNVNVQVTNTKPVAFADSYTYHWAAPKQTLSVMSNDNDADLDPISLKTVTGSTAAVKNGDVIDYTPKKDGVTDTFQYVITDTVTDADPATVTVTFTNNDKPVASSVSTIIHWRAFADQSNQQDFSVYSSTTDADGDSLTLTVNPTATGISGASCEKSADAIAKVRVKAPTKTTGTATCSFSISDGLANSGSKTAAVTITNSVPTCTDITVVFNAIYVSAGQTFSVASSVSDADSADVPYLAASSAILSGAFPGDTFSVSSGNLFFKPNGQLGNRVYGYKVSDGIVESSQCKFNIIVSSLSNADYSQSYEVHWNVTKAFLNVTAKLTTSTIVGIVQQPSQGTAYLEGGKIYFTPARKIYLDTFVVSVVDGITSNVTVSVSTYNNAPTASVSTQNVNWGKSIVINLLQNYADADYTANRETKGSVYSLDKTGTLGGVSSVSGSSVTYTSPTKYVGTDSFKVTATDGLAFVTYTVTINVINSAPVTNAKSFNVHWAVHKVGYTMNLATGVTDPQNDALTFDVTTGSVSPTSAGTVVMATSPNATATAGSSVYLGKFTFTYTASDSLLTTPGTATVTVYNNMATPVADSKSVHWRATNVALNPFAKFAASYKDTDGDSLTIQTATAQKGTVTIVTPGSQTLSYNAPTNPPALGTDVVTYKFTDGAESLQNTQTVVNINVVNTPPVATNQVVYGKWNSPVTVSLSNACSDVDTLDKPYVAFNGVINGVLGGTTSVSGTTVTFTPTTSSLVFTKVSGNLYNATASFKFQCNDGISTSTGNVTVILSNNAPTGTGNTVYINRDYTKPTYDFTWTQIATYANPDVDGDSVTVISLVSVDSAITVSNIGTGIRLVTPKTVVGTKQITFYLNDGLHSSSKLTFTVVFQNSAPTCTAVPTIYLNKRGVVDLSTKFSGSDSNNDVLTFTLSGSAGTLGTLSGKVFTASSVNTGSLSLSYTSSDSQLSSTACSIPIVIQNSIPSNDSVIYYIYPVADSLSHYFTYKSVDADGDTLTYTAGTNNCSSLATSLTISSTSGLITFKRIYSVVSGQCRMTVNIADNNNPSGKSTAIVTFIIIPKEPIAVDDRFSINQGQTIRIYTSQILANDMDELGTSSTLSFVNFSCPNSAYCHKTPRIVQIGSDIAIEVDSDQDTCQADKFRYTMRTGLGAERSADVYIEFKNCYCTAKLDFVFLLDSSQSIGEPNFDLIRDLCKRITGRMKLSKDAVKISIVRFHSYGTLALSLTTDGALVNKTLTNMKYDAGYTAQIPGLRMAVDALRVSNGGREDADKVIYILTDGLANVPCGCDSCENEWKTVPSVFSDSVQAKIINGMSGTAKSKALRDLCKYKYNTDGSELVNTDCNYCNFYREAMCLPCADAIPIAKKINAWKRDANGVVPNDPDNPYNGNNKVQWKVVAMAVGDAMTDVWGAREIEGMNYDSSRAITVSWTDLSSTMSEIVDQSCNQVNVQVPV